MKKISVILSVLILSLNLSSCDMPDDYDVNIAVMGDPDAFNADYLLGIEQALEDMNSEYADIGFTFSYDLYNDHGSYEEGAAIIEKLSTDIDLTAVIASDNIYIKQRAMHTFDEKNILYVDPFSAYDSFYSENYFDTVLSLSYSRSNIGTILSRAARASGARRWVVCTDDSKLSQTELKAFLNYEPADNDEINLADNDEINLIDCVSFSNLKENSRKLFKEWKLLGTEGILILSSDSRFDEVRMLKEEFPDLVYMGDSSFDKSNYYIENPETDRLMSNIIFTSDFPFAAPENDEEKERYDRLKNTFTEKNGKSPDLWFFHAYNMIRMIGDTAAQNSTTNSSRLAGLLHKNGYKGIRESFSFSSDGLRNNDTMQYILYSGEGIGQMITLD